MKLKNCMAMALAVVMAAGLFAGCSSSKEDQGEKREKVTVGTWKRPRPSPLIFTMNLCQKVSRFCRSPIPGDQKTALLAGSLDMCGTTLVTAITAASKGEPVKIVTSLCNKCSALVVGSDSGIQSEADLKGKRIAYVPGTMHHALLLEVLKRNGINPDTDVELKRIDFFDMGQALVNGDIDAF